MLDGIKLRPVDHQRVREESHAGNWRQLRQARNERVIAPPPLLGKVDEQKLRIVNGAKLQRLAKGGLYLVARPIGRELEKAQFTDQFALFCSNVSSDELALCVVLYLPFL